MKTRIITTVLGAIMLPIGIGIIIYYNYGMAAFDTFILVLSELLNLSYENALRLFQISILLGLLIYKKRLNLTWPDLIMPFISVAVISVLISITLSLSEIYLTNKPLIVLILAFLILTNGISLLVIGNIFLAPNDKLLNVIAAHTKHTYAFYKVISDVSMLTFSVILININDYVYNVTLFSIFQTFFTGIFVGIFVKINSFIFKK